MLVAKGLRVSSPVNVIYLFDDQTETVGGGGGCGGAFTYTFTEGKEYDYFLMMLSPFP